MQTLTVNGEAYDVEGTGRFEAQAGWTPGIQIFEYARRDRQRRACRRRSSVPLRTRARAGDWIPGAIRMEIDGEVLDDDDADPDDIAGLLSSRSKTALSSTASGCPDRRRWCRFHARVAVLRSSSY